MKLTRGSRESAGTNPTFECKQGRVGLLLESDENHPEYQQVAEHLEFCESCQRRLTELAGQHHEWEQVGELLSSYPAIDLDAAELSATGQLPPVGSMQDLPVQHEKRMQDHLQALLDPPTHPEMLGRLGRYEIEEVIGSGGMGIVLRGFDTELHRPVAIKILAQHLAHSGAARQRFTRESRAAAAVVHEHVVAIHDVDTDSPTPYLVMQYIAGESLQARVDREGPLTPKEVLRIGMQTAAGLQAAHAQGVIHRDIKPANILLERGVERVLVTDFGLARTVDDASLTHTGVIAGTPHYMSPEQSLGQATDARTDLFSLGSVLYFMATGHPPFRAEKAMGILNRICHEPHRPVWEINPDIPDELSDIIDRLLAKKPSRRYATTADVYFQLGRTLANLQQHRRIRFRGPKRFVRQHAYTLAAISVSIAVLFATLPWWLPQPIASQEPKRVTPNEHYTLTGEEVVIDDAILANKPQSFSVETWRIASPDELNAWSARISDINHDLERQQFLPVPLPYADTKWNKSLSEIQQQINQFELKLYPQTH